MKVMQMFIQSLEKKASFLSKHCIPLKERLQVYNKK